MNKCLKLIIFIISILILNIAIFIGLLLNVSRVFYSKPDYNTCNSISEKKHKINNSKKIDVLNKSGKLELVGWTNNDKNFVFDSRLINPSTTFLSNTIIGSYLNKFRYKKWNAYCFSSKDYVGTIAIFDLGYAGGILFSMSSLKDDKKIAYQLLNPFYRPVIIDQCNDDKPCKNGVFDELLEIAKNDKNQKVTLFNASIINQNHFLQFEYLEESGFNVKIDVKLNGKDKDSFVNLTPISEDRSLFYYNVKSYCLNSQGNSKINGLDTGEILFTHDAGRGVWPIKSGWIWINGNGKTKNNSVFGFNSGNGFTHPSAGFTEDSFFINGEMHKLINLEYIKGNDLNEYNLNNFFIRTRNELIKEGELKSTCDLLFTTVNSQENRMKFPEAGFTLYYGRFTGSCYDEEGNEYVIEWATGQIEDKHSTW